MRFGMKRQPSSLLSMSPRACSVASSAVAAGSRMYKAAATVPADRGLPARRSSSNASSWATESMCSSRKARSVAGTGSSIVPLAGEVGLRTRGWGASAGHDQGPSPTCGGAAVGSGSSPCRALGISQGVQRENPNCTRAVTLQSPTRRPLFVEGGQPFLGIVGLDDVADRLDRVLDGPTVFEVVGAHEGVARQLHDQRRLGGEVLRERTRL